MKTLRISNLTVLIDDADYELVNQFNWHKFGRYVATHQPKTRKVLLMHRLLMQPQSKEYVDHINQNGLDNRRVNLRLCTNSQNLVNRPKNRNNSTGFKGVTKCKDRDRFKVQICKDRKHICVGYFKDLDQAAEAYKVKARELFGEFAIA